MAVMSSLRAGLANCRSAIYSLKSTAGPSGNCLVPFRNLQTSSKRCGGGHGDKKFVISPSVYNWTLFKDQYSFYLMLGILPFTFITVCANIFVGPATLTETPEGYEPKHWEYVRRPVARWFTRYFWPNPQQVYEMNLHYIKEMEEIKTMRKLQRRAMDLMRKRGDYPAIYQQKDYTVNMPRGGGEEARRIRLFRTADTDTSID